MINDPDKSRPSPREAGFESQARREARRRSRGFSQELHGRIMRAVQTAGPADKATGDVVPRPDDGTAFRTGPAISAVLVAAVALIVLSRFHFDEPTLPLSVANSETTTMPATDPPVWPAMTTIEVVPARVRTAVATAVAQEQFAGLDQDARHMTRYLAKQVPFQNQWNNP
jgi:hypothetical protein